MKDSQIVATYSTESLRGIIRQLSASGQWWQRLDAAKSELSKRNRNRTRK